MSRPGIHFAALSNSPRLQRLLAFLQERGQAGATTREIVLGAEVMAVNSAVTELRKNNVMVDCFSEGRSPTGSNVYRYRLVAA